jgi:hypothetical protein
MEVDGAFMSRVLNSHVNLTPDQAALLCQFLKWGKNESLYFLTLVNLERAATPVLKEMLNDELAVLRKKGESFSHRFNTAALVPEDKFQLYFSAWYFGALHILLMLPEYQRVDALAARLGLPGDLIRSALEGLESMGLAEKKLEKWVALRTDIHLGNESLWASVYHSSWRQKSIMKVQERNPENLHFTGVHSMKKSDAERIRTLMQDAIQEVRDLANSSNEEEVFCLICDFYQL